MSSGEPIYYDLPFGFGVTPCPGCGEKPSAPARLVTVPGEWLPWHESCFNPDPDARRVLKPCEWCGRAHTTPHDGSCLL